MKVVLYPSPCGLSPARGRSASFVLKALPAALMLVFANAGWAVDPTINVGGAAGLPLNGSVAAGSASGNVDGNQLTITQTSGRAVIDWSSFNIDAGKAVHFAQPSNAAVLNRVSAATNASQISGALSADAMVMLMNPHGVLFNQGSSVNVGALIATTGIIDENTFTNTHARITGATGGIITNQGNITATAGASGLVALVAPSVVNRGVIAATGGTIGLLGSTAATISLNNGLYEFAIPGGATGIEVANTAGGTLNANTVHLGVGDAANLLSGIINLEGIQQASSAIVVNGDTVVLKSALQAPGVSGNSNRVDVYDGARIQDAVAIAKVGTPGAGAAVAVHRGSYAEQVFLNKANMALTGHHGAKILVPDSTEVNGINISANNVTVTGMEIAGPATQSYLTYAWGNNRSRGIAVGNGVTGFTISNNNIHDVRNGILIDGRNTGSVTGNRIDNTKSAISVQYTDGNGITIAGNTQGTHGNEWGLNLHLNGGVAVTSAPTLSWQQSLLDLSVANAGWSVQDQGYRNSNRTHVNVADVDYVSTNQGSLLAPLNSVQAGVNAVVTGGIVNVAAGNYAQPTTLTIDKSVTLVGAGQGATFIDSRGVNGYGVVVSADNVSLKGFTLYGPSANSESAYGIKVAPVGGGASARLRDFSIRDVTIRGSGKAELDLNGVVGATIDGVTADGAPVGGGTDTRGAGIQITDSADVTISNSTTRNNQWGGLALYQANLYRDQQVSNITVAASNNFTENNPVYLQDQSATRDFGALNIAGFDYAVRNGSSTNSNQQYTWLQASQQKAFDFAVNLGASASSYIQGWNGAITTQNFHVGTGSLQGGGSRAMSIGTAVDTATAGAVVNVYAGTFSESVRIGKALTLKGSGVQSIVDPLSGDAFAISGDLGAASTVLIDGFIFRDAPGSGVSVADNTVLGQLTVQNSSFRSNGHYGFSVTGSATAGVPGLGNVLLRDNTFEGNGNPDGGATALGLGDVHFNYFNGNATLKNLRITGTGEHSGIHFRGFHNAVGGAVRDAGRVVFDNVALEGSFRRPSSGVGTWNPGGPGYAIHLFEYGSVANVSFNDVAINATVGHGLAVEGLGSTLDIGNTRFGMADTSVIGTGTNPTASLNIMSGGNSRNDVKTNVNATAASFTGAATGFDIEDRVGHALDTAGSGLVTWSAGNVYVTQRSGSIQRGVDAAGLGETVNVASGRFAENVAVNARRDLAFSDTRLQSLTLGSGAAGSGVGGTVTAEGAGGIVFDASVRLLADTTLATTGANITLNGDIQNAGDVARGLRLVAGSGATRGNVHMNTGGSAARFLGQLDVVSHDFKLDSTLWVGSYKIDALGKVALSNSTLRAQDTGGANTLNAGGDVTGSTISRGSVEVTSGSNIQANIAGTDVSAQAQGAMEVVVTASQTATLTADTIVANITATDVVATSQGDMNVVVAASNSASLAGDSVVANVTAPVLAVEAVNDAQISGSVSRVTVDAPRGSVSGNFGQVSNTGSGLVNVNGKPQGNATLSGNTENSRVVPAGGMQEGGVDGGVTQAAVGGQSARQSDSGISLSTPEAAGDALDSGRAVELDMSPRRQRGRDNKKSKEDTDEREKGT